MAALPRLFLCAALGGGAITAAVGPVPKAAAATAISTIAVTATVISACSILATSLAFGNYSATGGAVAATARITITCGNPTAYNLGLDAGTGIGATVAAREMTNLFTNAELSYGLFQDSGHSQVWGPNVGSNTVSGSSNVAPSLTVFGLIPTGQNSPTGSYSDTVTATISY
jgi:spore coat protein U-like protein